MQNTKIQLDEIFQVIKHIYQTKFIFGDCLEEIDENFKIDKAEDLHADEVPPISDPNQQNNHTISDKLKVAEGIIRKLYARSMELTQENRRLKLEVSRLKESGGSPRQSFAVDHQNYISDCCTTDLENNSRYKHNLDMERPSSARTAPSSEFQYTGTNFEREGAISAPASHSFDFTASQVAPRQASKAPISEMRTDSSQLGEEQTLREIVAGLSLMGFEGQFLVDELHKSRRREALLRAQLQAHIQQSRELDVLAGGGEINSLVGRDREKLMIAKEMLRDLTDSSYHLQGENAMLRQRLTSRDELARCRYFAYLIQQSLHRVSHMRCRLLRLARLGLSHR